MDPATTEIYTLSLHDALPISARKAKASSAYEPALSYVTAGMERLPPDARRNHYDLAFAYRLEKRSEEHTSELQSQSNLVCRLLLEKKNIEKLDVVDAVDRDHV